MINSNKEEIGNNNVNMIRWSPIQFVFNATLSSPILLKLVYMQAMHKKILCYSIFSLLSDVSRQNLMLEVNATVWYLNHNSAGQFQIPVKPSGPDSSSITLHPNLLISIAALL